MERTSVRPPGITALAAFFAFGALATGVAAITLTFPGTSLDGVWTVNARGHLGLLAMGRSGIALMALVCLCCAWSAIGLWRGFPSGYRLAIVMLAINAVGDAVSGDRETLTGILIVAMLIAYMATARVRAFFFGKPSALE
jgi:hypothetical protein